MKDLDAELELPMDEDENVGDGIPKKRIKRKKTKEERSAERKVVFWTFLVIVGATVLFWLMPKIKEFTFGFLDFNSSDSKVDDSKSGWKNYVEYKL